ncbi:MAG: hypothetical protein JWR02_1940 [Mucilaginibacter sp.]|nr:hypothetical protein [Mucilaginibacter sp.]
MRAPQIVSYGRLKRNVPGDIARHIHTDHRLSDSLYGYLIQMIT